MSGRMLTPAEVAERVGVSTATLRSWRWKKAGPAYVKVSAQTVRYPEAELDAWLDSRRVAGAVDA